MIASAEILCYPVLVWTDLRCSGNVCGVMSIPITNSNKGQKYELESIILR